ncbi:hypothetical protein DACRYDRAFT_23908 [Dacryopinax primogenitus]|uniref:Uncharacterized protein n=1 Tax=Dacryopinax primogenitus (strain DJM 731) TaxID=1858805 RepID=M5G0I5_DACPD|nr:uncharacterized protein DACRYDRAFT_23908 [Dacryopinax primogenitus]EJT99341.1 hypothetical protein DACRYDRAFT_23908 [Dacryopinax primogenitus]
MATTTLSHPTSLQKSSKYFQTRLSAMATSATRQDVTPTPVARTVHSSAPHHAPDTLPKPAEFSNIKRDEGEVHRRSGDTNRTKESHRALEGPPSDDISQGLEVNANGLDVWIQNTSLAQSFEENATVQTSLDILGLTDQSQRLAGMEIALLPHQIIGVAWMIEQETSQNIRHFGGILADEMGLGKTVQMIATMTFNRPTQSKQTATLIVCPLALLSQWKAEIETKSIFKSYVYHGAGRTKSHHILEREDVVLTTYHTLAAELPISGILKGNSHPEEPMENDHQRGPLLKACWYRVVFDEAQVIRNRHSRQSSAAARLHSTLRWCLTGTPIINSLSDVFPLMRALRIHPWYEWRHFYSHIVKNEKTNSHLCGKRLQGVFRTCLLRRNKNTMLDGKRLIELPNKEIQTLMLDFSDDEREIYNMVEKRAQGVFNRFLREGTVLKNYSQVFSLLMRLRQCAFHPALIQQDYDEAVLEIMDESRRADEIKRARLLVSSKFVEQVKALLKNAARERIHMEQESTDNQVEDDCLICLDAIDQAVIAPCQHAFCKACALELCKKASNEQAHSSSQHPHCPSCHSPFREELLFARSAFEPTDAELGLQGSEASPARIRATLGDNKVGSNPITSRGWEYQSDTESDGSFCESESEASLRDLIVHSDEEETEEDAEKAAKKAAKNKIKRATGHQRPRSRDWSLDDMSDIMTSRHSGRRREATHKLLPSTKMNTMMKSLKASRKDKPADKTLVISQFVSALDVVAGYLDEQRFTYVRYQGSMTKTARENTVKNFMGVSGPTVMLMSLNAGGVGLNLTCANHVISLDLGWSEAIEAQAFDRVHRFGQVKDVHVERLVIKNTVEDRILALHKRKQGLADHSLGEGNGKKLRKLSVQDLQDLFGGKL